MISIVFKAPNKAYPGDAGFDVYNNSGYDIEIGPHEWAKIPLGFRLEIPEDWVAVISEKSGMATNHGLLTIGNIIDCNYRGECHATVLNASRKSVIIDSGQKVAQLLIHPCYTGNEIVLTETLSPTNRGEQGFGSSGVK
jgi:dUTP pyrophosphatase